MGEPELVEWDYGAVVGSDLGVTDLSEGEGKREKEKQGKENGAGGERMSHSI